MILTRETI